MNSSVSVSLPKNLDLVGSSTPPQPRSSHRMKAGSTNLSDIIMVASSMQREITSHGPNNGKSPIRVAFLLHLLINVEFSAFVIENMSVFISASHKNQDATWCT